MAEMAMLYNVSRALDLIPSDGSDRSQQGIKQRMILYRVVNPMTIIGFDTTSSD